METIIFNEDSNISVRRYATNEATAIMISL